MNAVRSWSEKKNVPFLNSCYVFTTVTATTDVSGCSVWICGICDAKASSYLGSGRMTEVIEIALYAEVLGPWDSDCAGGRLLSKDTGNAGLWLRHSRQMPRTYDVEGAYERWLQNMLNRR